MGVAVLLRFGDFCVCSACAALARILVSITRKKRFLGVSSGSSRSTGLADWSDRALSLSEGGQSTVRAVWDPLGSAERACWFPRLVQLVVAYRRGRSADTTKFGEPS